MDFDQTRLDPPETPTAHTAAITKRTSDIEGFMMKPHDYFLGVIINHIDAVEEKALENAWNMRIDWRTTRPVLAAEAQADGIMNAGQGRFDGVIEVTPWCSF